MSVNGTATTALDPTSTSPTEDELEELLLDARYDDVEALTAFATQYGTDHFANHADERGNTCLHMASANGHVEAVEYLLPHLPTSAFIRPNAPPASNTPLHWAAMNHHLAVLKLLCPRLTAKQISATNGRGRSAMSEAMEGTGRATRMKIPKEGEEGPEEPEDRRREDCVSYLVEMMRLGEEDEEGKDVERSNGRQEELDTSSAEVTNGVEDMKLSDPAS